ncbi:MAG: hypothetical protein AMXMBFR16_11980 [Candidatus Uhrbacteria bacterium]
MSEFTGGQFADSHQVVGRGGELKLLLDLPSAHQARAAHPGDRIDPAKGLFNFLATPLAQSVACRAQPSGHSLALLDERQMFSVPTAKGGALVALALSKARSFSSRR